MPKLLSWIPPSSAKFIYSVILKPKYLRILTHAIVRGLIPKKIHYRGVDLVLNQTDPVLCGAIALGCYDWADVDTFEQILRPGMCVIDVGANIGIYTAVAALKVGQKGHVISIEPNPDIARFIGETIHANNFQNVRIFNVALSNVTGSGKLFIANENAGDSRIFECEDKRQIITIRTTTLDDLIEKEAIPPIDVIKMDIQGAEAIALEGMEKTLAKNSNIRILMEFWPYGIRRSGHDPAKMISGLWDLGFSIYEINRNSGEATLVTNADKLTSMKLFRQDATILVQKNNNIR
jgi:FkbM family methyltransferase